MEIAGAAAPVAPDDRITVPAGVPQGTTTTGTGPLRFYGLCTPRSRPSAYRDLET